MNHIGTIIEKAQASSGMNQVQLEKAAGVSKGTISHIKNGKHDPQIGTVLKIMRACGWEIVFKPKYGTLQKGK